MTKGCSDTEEPGAAASGNLDSDRQGAPPSSWEQSWCPPLLRPPLCRLSISQGQRRRAEEEQELGHRRGLARGSCLAPLVTVMRRDI